MSHLIVDGYNIIHAWPHTRRLLRQGGAIAINALAGAIGVIHDQEGWQVSIVLDGRGEALSFEHPGGQPTFSLVYTPAGLAADTVIEQLVNRLPRPEEAVVASRDNLVVETTAAIGARPMSPEALLEWVGRGRASQGERLSRRRKNLEKDWKEAGPWDSLEGLFKKPDPGAPDES